MGLTTEDKAGLAGHLGSNLAVWLFGLPIGGLDAAAAAVAKLWGRPPPGDFEAALTRAGADLGVDREAVRRAGELLAHAEVDARFIVREVYGEGDGPDDEAARILAHIRARAAQLPGVALDGTAYAPALDAFHRAARQLMAHPDFLDTLKYEFEREQARFRRRVEAQLTKQASTGDLEDRLAERERELEEARATIAELAARSQEPGQDRLQAVLARVAEGGDAGELTDLLAAALADTEGAWKQADAAGRAATVRAARELASVAYWTDTERALAAWRKVAELDPADLWAPIEVGRLEERKGDLAAARAAFEEAEARAERAQDRRHVVVARASIADVHRAQGDLARAVAHYEEATTSLASLAEAEPDNPDRQGDLSVSHDRIGDVRVARGDLGGALAAYEAGLAIFERLATGDPSNSLWQRDLSVSHEKIGDVRTAQGELAAALSAYEAGHAIREQLAAGDPSNSAWQRDLFVSHSKIGDVRRAQGDLAGALEAYEAGLAIAERLTAGDPSNSEWQRDLIVSNVKLAQVAEAQDDAATAAGRYRAALATAGKLAAEGRLAPRDAWMPEELRRLLAGLGG